VWWWWWFPLAVPDLYANNKKNKAEAGGEQGRESLLGGECGLCFHPVHRGMEMG